MPATKDGGWLLDDSDDDLIYPEGWTPKKEEEPKKP